MYLKVAGSIRTHIDYDAGLFMESLSGALDCSSCLAVHYVCHSCCSMSDNGDDVGRPNKKQKVDTPPDDIDETACCIVCMRSREELATGESPLMDHHSCPQCNISSWSICEECEEHCLSRKCPVCRGQYAPIVLYAFPDLQPNAQSSNPILETKLFKAKMTLLLKLVGGSNTAVYLPGDNILRFLLPQEFGANDDEARFLQVDIGDAYNRVINGTFEFTDKVWDELEEAQNAADEAAAGDAGDVPSTELETVLARESTPRGPASEQSDSDLALQYVAVSDEDCAERFAARVGHAFVDTQEGLNFKIVSVVRRAGDGSDILYFKYYDTDKHPAALPDGATDYEYTPCEEILSSSWVSWESDRQDWIQCIECSKWRKLPKRGAALYPTELADDWTCAQNTWDDKNSCEAAEDSYDNTSDEPPARQGSVDGSGSVGEDSRGASGGPGQQHDMGTDGTIGLNEAIRRIIHELKNIPGTLLLTRLPAETTESILRIAMESA